MALFKCIDCQVVDDIMRIAAVLFLKTTITNLNFHNKNCCRLTTYD
ncbi:hypothetical protein [Chamaesiphon sp. GL140_3_metabinner_50]|nr:hypothetical protein [Chamaesiphon sp. GL140_3_metabinner_50]